MTLDLGAPLALHLGPQQIYVGAPTTWGLFKKRFPSNLKIVAMPLAIGTKLPYIIVYRAVSVVGTVLNVEFGSCIEEAMIIIMSDYATLIICIF